MRQDQPDPARVDPLTAVVLTSRARLARNIAGFPFVGRATEAQRREIVRIARQVLLGDGMEPRFEWVDLVHAGELERRLLVERHCISANLAECDIDRAVALAPDDGASVMVNEEDHLRIQAVVRGLRLRDAWRTVDEIDDRLERRLDFAFSRRWGYLTACPTNLGTGVRFGVMMHLPALKLTGEIDRVRRAAKELHLAVRGYYGEGSESAGDFYQISNQVTLGQRELDLLETLERDIVPRIAAYELEARRMLVERDTTMVDDRVHRALGTLRSARLLGADEAMKLLSRVRLGVHLGRLAEPDPAVVDRLFIEIQPAHLRRRGGAALEGEAIRTYRAEVVREALGG